MAKEMRRIVLSDAEVTEALTDFVRIRRRAFHDGTFQSSRYTREMPLEVEITVRTPTGQESTFVLGGPHLAAAIIHYCVRLRIPMPRKAAKMVKRLKDGVGLDMIIEPP